PASFCPLSVHHPEQESKVRLAAKEPQQASLPAPPPQAGEGRLVFAADFTVCQASGKTRRKSEQYRGARRYAGLQAQQFPASRGTVPCPPSMLARDSANSPPAH